MAFNSFTLFAANAVILLVMALAFALAGQRRKDEAYWRFWAISNLVLAASLVLFMSAGRMPFWFSALAANGLLITGLVLRLTAARQFNARTASAAWTLLPLAFFAAVAVPGIAIANHGIVFAATNVILALLSVACAVEFGRRENTALPSRHGLIGAYLILAASFAVRALQGIWTGNAMTSVLPDDSILMAHLIVALFHTVGSGAFALSMAHEREARQLTEAARRDMLTGLLNRGAFEADAAALLEADRARSFALILMDIDRFKAINDVHGHAAGDAALIALAAILRRNAEPDAIIGRIGGEEFAIFLPCADPDRADELAETLRLAARRLRLEFVGGKVRLTVSAGVAIAQGLPLQELSARADACLYQAKNGGRDQVHRTAA